MAGMTLTQLGVDREPIPAHVSVKESVFPFRKFVGVDIVLGPEMRSTGEVMGVSRSFSIAFAKSQLAAGVELPSHGKIFVSVTSRYKDHFVELARRLNDEQKAVEPEGYSNDHARRSSTLRSFAAALDRRYGEWLRWVLRIESKALLVGIDDYAHGTSDAFPELSGCVNDVERVRDLRPGECLYIENDGVLNSRDYPDEIRHTPCIFEYVYFARPDSLLNGRSVYRSRVKMGRQLAAEHPVDRGCRQANCRDLQRADRCHH